MGTGYLFQLEMRFGCYTILQLIDEYLVVDIDANQDLA
jgi:CMP-N-acetylneuraminic acid synthetase